MNTAVMKALVPAECPEFIPAYLEETQTHKGIVTARRHPNGGGWVDSTSRVAPTVRVSRNASVRGRSVVIGNVCVSGDSVVSDSAIYGGDGENGIQVVDSIVDRSELDRDGSMPTDRLSVISASVLRCAELVNPPIIHDEAIRDTRN